jgi:hypothetical protein
MTTVEHTMRSLAITIIVAALAGCGVETASTAATGAVIKAKEAEAAKKSQEQMRLKIDQTMEQAQQRADRAGEAAQR